MTAKLLLGDCLEILKTLPDNSVDSLVTDPPAGISFMGKDWDSAKGGRKEWIAWMADVMRECLRVMKPGAHGLVWAIPRTSHWTATALEDAGFEVRDVITHLFGQGFPKSLDISKAIDKAAGAEREKYLDPKWSDRYPNGPGGGGSPMLSQARPDILKNPLMTSDPVTDAAKQWAGWGTALKPASEHWILVRKPCEEKTVAANVLEWGVGGINVDGCRIGLNPAEDVQKLNARSGGKRGFSSEYVNGVNDGKLPSGCDLSKGRFPANLVLSHSPYCTDDQCDIECAIERLNGQSGTLKTGGDKRAGTKGQAFRFEGGNPSTQAQYIGDSGGASRFFYCAKISPSERGEDNKHPTVKAQKLMRYFCRLVTPPGGIVLDPFMGSGSTGLAAKGEGFQFIGIEKDPGYFEISTRRIDG